MIENILKNKSILENLILDRSFYERDTSVVAQALLGKILVAKSVDADSKNEFCAGIIVEDEAYYGLNDPASHACNGETPRSKIMFETPGIAYVYFCYGNHWLLNTVTEKFGIPGAVLIRAIEPLHGINLMVNRRSTDMLGNLTNGPGKLTQAFGIKKNFNGMDLTNMGSSIFVIDGKEFGKQFQADKKEIVSKSRIGIKNGTDKLLRFYIKDNKFVSKK
ncbi:MAG: DNA-3-methyladenine glycosylase [Actinobacteria bacterium]|nr:DNA-3-methyladenine glycosylase [Actinomycetota bacterium]